MSLEELSDILQILKGGSGSGDWGHVGRAGKRGGSGGGGGKGRPRKGRRSREALGKEIERNKKKDSRSKERELIAEARKITTLPRGLKLVDTIDDLSPDSLKRGYWIVPDGRILDFSEHKGRVSHPAVIKDNANNKNFATIFGFSDEDIDTAKRDPEGIAINKGAVRITVFGKEIGMSTNEVNTRALRKMQKLYDKGKILIKKGSFIWENNPPRPGPDEPHNTGRRIVATDLKGFLSAKFAVDTEATRSGTVEVMLKSISSKLNIITKMLNGNIKFN